MNRDLIDAPRIVLARHGRPDATVEDRRPIRGTDIGRWCRRYNELGIKPTSVPPPRLLTVAGNAGHIIASDLRRAVESARLLAGLRPVHTDTELREAALPEVLRTRLRLYPGAWIVAARIAWLLDRCESEEAVAAARQRATRVAEHLIAVAARHQSVLVVGHGFFNRLVAIELRRQGWQGPGLIRTGYWASGTYSPGHP